MHRCEIKNSNFGVLSDGTDIGLYTINNGRMSCSFTNYGCAITSIILPYKHTLVDVALGFSTLDGFVNDKDSFGAVVGRFANRIGGASFNLDGNVYTLDKNDNGINTLHGGYDRLEKKAWNVDGSVFDDVYGDGVKFSRVCPDGEQGFPGNLCVSITYFLNDKNDITILYEAKTDKPTVVNLTNHSYFNLSGQNSGLVDDHVLQMNCSKYLEVDKNLIPTGKYLDVEGTPFDFTKPKKIGKDISKVGIGYDHCFCFDDFDGTLKEIATVEVPEYGRKMVVRSTLPGIQFYTGNYIENIKGKNGYVYRNHGALCLETESYPDAPNKRDFPSVILRPGEVYRQVTQYSFVF